MCNAEVQVLNPPACGLPAGAESKPRGSRRRRLWDLPSATHCPLIGLGLPTEALRRVIEKALHGRLRGDDYAAHCLGVQHAAQRGTLAEGLQRALDTRHALTLKRFAAARDEAALSATWQEARHDGDVGAALWAVLTHPRCTPLLEATVLQNVHMLQHEAGAARRAHLERGRALQAERDDLAQALQNAQDRAQRAQAESQARIDGLQAELVQVRGEALRKDRLLEQLQAERSAAQGSEHASAALADQGQRLEVLAERCRVLTRQLDAANTRLGQSRSQQARLPAVPVMPAVPAMRAAPTVPHGALLAAESAGSASAAAADGATADIPTLNARCVLCVGGMSGVVDRYRRVVEGKGAEFIHHDGGIEHSLRRLDGQLGAADLVVCQAGCLNHEAYQQVKAHCKRHGKPCVYLDNPSLSSFVRGLSASAAAV